MEELSKYIKGEHVTLNRSQVNLADYNPRSISEEAKKTLKRGIKKFGLLGDFIVNKNGMTLVSGHQRISVMDDLQKYNDETKENDYKLSAVLIDVDDKEEKELVILLNNPNAQGSWDYDKLRQLIPDIDYKDAGLTEADLSMIGVDYMFETEGESKISDELEDLMSEYNQEHREEVEQRKAEREELRQAEKMAQELQQEEERQAKVDHMKDVKQQVKEKEMADASNMDAYLMLSFDTFENKANFCQRFGFDQYSKFIKGEVLDERSEVVYDDEDY